eukprot:TRINITY_DN1376_c3_g1_i1.p1 TRINITY_DN1376_c3_g1~~TRINITY_DN1376_c3_g1_i1.p1  ORF type:complete len:283 (+),score=75.17 TRINITY_DN1376_c3_g1_i1:23-871(+)
MEGPDSSTSETGVEGSDHTQARTTLDDDYTSDSVRALFDFTGEGGDQLTFKEGAILTHVEEIGGGWSRGMLHGKEGLFPSDYVERLGAEENFNGDGHEGDEAGEGATGGDEQGAGADFDKKERRRRAEEALEQMERQIEDDKLQKAELELELDQLRLVREHTRASLDEMSVARSDVVTLLHDLMAVLFQLDHEIDGMAELEGARLGLQAELGNVNESITREIKKGSPLEPFKADIGRKLSMFQLSLADDGQFTGIYEKRKGEFYFILKQLLERLRSEAPQAP